MPLQDVIQRHPLQDTEDSSESLPGKHGVIFLR